MESLNPFMRSTGNPPRKFAGREEELHELEKALSQTTGGMPEHIIFFGPFGIGKTSLLIEFQKRIRGAKAVRVPLYTTENITEICDIILRESRIQLKFKETTIKKIINSLGRVGFDILGTGVNLTLRKVEMNPQSALKELIGGIYGSLERESTLVLMIDDLHRMAGVEGKGSATVLSILSNALLALNQERKKVMFVGTGTYRIFEQLRSYDESSVRMFHPCEIGPLSHEEVTETITESSKEMGVEFSDDVIDKIFELSGGNPYYVQVLSHYFFEHRRRKTVSMDRFEEAFEKALSELVLKEFKKMYGDMSPGARRILATMAESDRDEMTYSELQETSKGIVSSYLNELIEKEGIVRDRRGVYRLRDRLFAQYLRIYKPYAHNGSCEGSERTSAEKGSSVMEHSRDLKEIAKRWREDLVIDSPYSVVGKSPDIRQMPYSTKNGEVKFEMEDEDLFEDLIQRHLPKRMKHIVKDFSSLKRLLGLYLSKIESVHDRISEDAVKQVNMPIGKWSDIGIVTDHFPYEIFVSAIENAQGRELRTPAYSTKERTTPSPCYEIWCGSTGIGKVRTRTEAEKLKRDHDKLCRNVDEYIDDAKEIIALEDELRGLGNSIEKELKRLLHYPKLPGDCEYLSPM